MQIFSSSDEEIYDVGIERVVSEIQARHIRPEDHFEIAALLESMGWNDARVEAEFGYPQVFDLAKVIWGRIAKTIEHTTFPEREKVPAWKTLVEDVRTFIRGVIFAVPMAISVVAMLTLKLSLWSYENLSVDLATAIAIGTILSFVTVGGFTQAIARRGYFYVIQGYYRMARKITFYFIGIGFLVCIAVSILIVVFNTLIQVFPYHLLAVIVAYFFFLNAIWLSVTVMYILRKEMAFTGLIVFGIAIVATLFYRFHLNIIYSQLIALVVVSVSSILMVIYFFNAEERKGREKGIAPKLPPMSVTVYSVLPYLTYGMLYFAFLYADRVIAWSANDTYMPYPIWFRGNYELGLDFALLVLILPMGFAEVALNQLMQDIQDRQRDFTLSRGNEFTHRFLRSYRRKSIVIGVVSALSGVLIYGVMRWIFRTYPNSIGQSLFTNHITYFVFIWAVIGYILIALSLMNAVTLFSLSVPEYVLRSLWPAFFVNVIGGFLLSRWISYSYAVIGMVLGACIFIWLSSRYVTKALKNLDFFLYAAS